MDVKIYEHDLARSVDPAADLHNDDQSRSKRLRKHLHNDNPPLMDRSGIVRSSFVRQANDRGQTPTELVGRAYRKPLFHLLQNTAKRGPVWEERKSKWPEEQISEQREKYYCDINFELTPEEVKRIEYYITQDIEAEDVEQLPRALWQRVMEKIKPQFVDDKRLRGLFIWLRQRAAEDWDRASRETLLREALLDPWQKKRLKVRSMPPPFPRFVITGPAPWSHEFEKAREFCVSSLTMAFSVVIRSHPIWYQVLGDEFEILPSYELYETRPFYLNDIESKVESYLNNSRHRILHYIFLCAEHMWKKQKEWDYLVSKESGVSEVMVSLLNSLSSLACRLLRDKTLEARDTWTKVVLHVEQSTEEFPVKPLVNFRLDDTTKQVRDDMERAKNFIITTLLRIFEVTRDLPTVGTLMFNPDHKYRNISSP